MKHGVGTLIFFALIAVLILTHASSFAAAVTAVGGQTYDQESMLTGSGSAQKTVPSTVSKGGGSYSVA